MFLGLCSHPSQFRHGWRNRCKQPWMADFASVADILNKYFRVLRTSCFEQPEAKRIDIFVYTFKTLTPIWPQHHMMLGAKGILPPMIPDCFVLCTLAILKNIHNSLIFLRKMATYSCFWRVPRSKILLQASLHQISDLLILISSYIFSVKAYLNPTQKSPQ